MHAPAGNDIAQRARRADREHDDGNRVLPHQADRRGVHHPQVLGQDIEIGQGVIADGLGVALRIGGVDAIDAGALQQGVAAHLRRPQGRGGVGGEERVAGAGGEDHHPPLLQMPLGAASDIGLAHGLHGYGGLDAGVHIQPLQGILHGERVHHGRQHAHVVGAGPLHALGRRGQAAEDVAPADHQAQLDAEARDLGHRPGYGVHGRHVDAIGRIPHQHLPRHLQQDAPIEGRAAGRGGGAGRGGLTHGNSIRLLVESTVAS